MGIFKKRRVANNCESCGVPLLTDVELQGKLLQLGVLQAPGIPSSTGGLGTMDMSTFLEASKARNSVGVACRECGAVFCVACMETHGKPHPSSGGLSCLECGGALTGYSGG